MLPPAENMYFIIVSIAFLLFDIYVLVWMKRHDKKDKQYLRIIRKNASQIAEMLEEFKTKEPLTRKRKQSKK